MLFILGMIAGAIVVLGSYGTYLNIKEAFDKAVKRECDIRSAVMTCKQCKHYKPYDYTMIDSTYFGQCNKHNIKVLKKSTCTDWGDNNG